tara:strand:- start:353 stop:601 length:249 start_codon:yes stop_codon:yes gene_type:complete
MPKQIYKKNHKKIQGELNKTRKDIEKQEDKVVSLSGKDAFSNTNFLDSFAKLRKLQEKEKKLIQRKKTNLSKLAKAERKGKI